MTDLPVFNQEPASSLWAVMLFPEDKDKAQAYASHHLLKLNGPLDTFFDHGHSMSHKEVVRIGRMAHADFRRNLSDESKQNLREGFIVGEVVGRLFRQLKKDPSKANWSWAVRWTAKDYRCPVKTVGAYRQRMRRVYAFWGAFNLRGNQLFSEDDPQDPESVYRFMYEADDIILRTLHDWSLTSKQLQNNAGHLNADHYRRPAWAMPSQIPI
jgi:hypothetical protein